MTLRNRTKYVGPKQEEVEVEVEINKENNDAEEGRINEKEDMEVTRFTYKIQVTNNMKELRAILTAFDYV